MSRMTRFASITSITARLFGAALLLLGSASATAELTVGVSWSNFHEERWKTDEAAIVAELERQGARYVSADAQSSPEKQASDIESLIARGVDALIILPHDAQALVPAVRAAQREGIPVLAYDRLIELPGVVYVSYENREIGRMQAREILRAVPTGRYVFIKGSPQDPNANTVHGGQLDVLQAAIDTGDIEVVGDQYVDGWLPELAQQTMEQILTSNDDAVDAVVCSNDGMAGGVVAALAAQGLSGIPVSGQDADHAALNRIARGTQSVTVWKDVRDLGRDAAAAALHLAKGGAADALDGRIEFKDRADGPTLDAVLLKPVSITRENLGLIIDAGWVSREAVCRGVSADAQVAACKVPSD
jgi:D-xylose transport system substrate-binding protein